MLDQECLPYSPFFSSSPKRCETGECGGENRTDAFEGNLNETLWNVLPKLNTTHAFVRVGWNYNADFENRTAYSCILQDFQRHHPNIKLFQISSLPELARISNPASSFDPTKLKCDIGVLDCSTMNKTVPRNWYRDIKCIFLVS